MQAIDRRSSRAKHGAGHTPDVFAARLRDQVDQDHVRADLLRVVGDTVRPTHASVWLRRP